MARDAGATPQLAAREETNRRRDRPIEAPESKRVEVTSQATATDEG